MPILWAGLHICTLPLASIIIVNNLSIITSQWVTELRITIADVKALGPTLKMLVQKSRVVSSNTSSSH